MEKDARTYGEGESDGEKTWPGSKRTFFSTAFFWMSASVSPEPVILIHTNMPVVARCKMILECPVFSNDV